MTRHDQDAIASLTTEQRDPTLADIDLLSIAERCVLQNQCDQSVAPVIASEIASIASAVELIVASIRNRGRLVYVGAGTSGRLGVLDAAECPPTFGTDPDLVQAIIAGGTIALTQAVEGIEDDASAGATVISDKNMSSNDCVVGISASGRTPFVIGALNEAKLRGVSTVAVTNNRPSEIEQIADIVIGAVVGPEFIAGSTRLKAGTAQKLILNMLTTQTMIELGKTYGNAMVDVMATNAKLKFRAHRMVQEITGATDDAVADALTAASGSAKLAILMLLIGVDSTAGARILERSQGKLRVALEHSVVN